MHYGPLCEGTWEDHGYEGPADPGDTTHPGYPEIRNMAPAQVACSQSAELDLASKLEVQGLQDELQELQGAVHNFEAEIKWIAEGGDTKAQRLQAEMESVWEELRLHSEMQSSTQQLQDQARKLQGLELHHAR